MIHTKNNESLFVCGFFTFEIPQHFFEFTTKVSSIKYSITFKAITPRTHFVSLLFFLHSRYFRSTRTPVIPSSSLLAPINTLTVAANVVIWQGRQQTRTNVEPTQRSPHHRLANGKSANLPCLCSATIRKSEESDTRCGFFHFKSRCWVQMTRLKNARGRNGEGRELAD